MHHYCDYDKSHTHTTVLRPFSGTTRVSQCQCQKKNILLDFTVQGKISDADTPTIRLGATPSGLISDPPPFHFYAVCPSCCKFYCYCSKLLFNQFIFHFGQVSKGVQLKFWKPPFRKWMHFLKSCENNEILLSTSHVNHMSSTARNTTEIISFTVYAP